MGVVKRSEVYWVKLDPTLGSEIRKTHPCLVVSPNDMNSKTPRVIIAPLTSKGSNAGCRPIVDFNNQVSKILLDQICSVDKRRLQEKIGSILPSVWQPTLLEMFK